MSTKNKLIIIIITITIIIIIIIIIIIMIICQKWFGVLSLELFPANTRSFQLKKLSSKTFVTLPEEAQFIRTNSDKGVVKL